MIVPLELLDMYVNQQPPWKGEDVGGLVAFFFQYRDSKSVRVMC